MGMLKDKVIYGNKFQVHTGILKMGKIKICTDIYSSHSTLVMFATHEHKSYP